MILTVGLKGRLGDRRPTGQRREGVICAFLQRNLAIITSPTATPIGLAMLSVVLFPWFIVVALPPRSKMVLVLPSRIVGCEAIDTGEPPEPLGSWCRNCKNQPRPAR
jgi:hypothetical protein